MLAKPLLREILNDEALTRGLADPEARVLVEWLVERADQFADSALSAGELAAAVRRLCRRARGISRFVCLWSQPAERGAAVQLAAAERFTWPFPECAEDPCELMQTILYWENRPLAQ